MISAIAAAGIFFAVPISGRAAVGRLFSVPAVSRPSVWICAGAAIWSVPLLGALISGAYRPWVIGAAGWIVVVIYLGRQLRLHPRRPRLSRSDKIALVGTGLAAILAMAHPSDPFATGRDMGVYANHAVYMVNHGRLDVPYMWDADPTPPPGFQPFGGFYATQATMTVQFAHLYPAWLAQTYAVLGYDGLVRLNIAVGLFSLLAIFGFAKRFVSPMVAAIAILFLAFNPAQSWAASTTLSEGPTQLFIWCGLLLLGVHLARGSPRLGILAGILLGASALIRIDSFLLVPLLLAAHAIWNVLVPRGGYIPARTWAFAYVGAAPTFALAAAYYVLFSRPYLVQQATQVQALVVLTVACAVLLTMSVLPLVRRMGQIALARRFVLLSLFGGLGLVTAYAFFIRPLVPPFDVIDAPGNPLDGRRSHIEDALPNLGRYLSPPVVWAALAGWSVVMARQVRLRGVPTLLPFLTVAVGTSAVYVWNQSISPDHFWAIRRFVPVIIPAIVILAAAFAATLLARSTIRARRLIQVITIVSLSVHTALIAAPKFGVEDRAGSYLFLAEFADSLPAGREILALGDTSDADIWWMPMYVSFDRPILPLNITTEDGVAEGLLRLRIASETQPVVVLTAQQSVAETIEGRRSAEATLSRTVLDQPTVPVPDRTFVEAVTLTSIMATGLDTLSVEFGGRSVWLAPETGFHRALLLEGRTLRWTNGHGRIQVPIEGARTPDRLAIALADTGPGGGRLQIVVNGASIFDGVVPGGAWTAELELGGIVGLQPGGMADIEIVSDVFRASPIDGEQEEPYGVRVQSVILLDSQS